MIPRNAATLIQRMAKGFPVVALIGPRQSGKTTLVRELFSEKAYVSLENPDLLEFAQEDPRRFLDTYAAGAVFDEAQRCPQLFSYLQQVVDDDPRPGRFVVTGSQQFGLHSKISQSLAGRVGMTQLLPFAYDELYADSPAEPSLNELLWKGFYPPVHDREVDPHLWYGSYIQTYLERDVRQMLNVKELGSFRRFVRLCAGRNAQILNLSSLANDCGIAVNTAKSWISILEASFIVFRLQPHFINFNKRLIKSPKLYFYDSGLVMWLLSIPTPQALNLHPSRGAVFESFVVSELLKMTLNAGTNRPFYFWRDRQGNEVDLLVDHGSHLQPIEIKSSQTMNPDYLKGLQKWMSLAQDQGNSPALVYGGDQWQHRQGIQVVPWRQLASTFGITP